MTGGPRITVFYQQWGAARSCRETYMLFHIRPRLYSPFRVELIDFTIDPVGIRLVGGVDLATRRPYANKFYAVACRKRGKKAIDGIFIETAAGIDELHTTARWAVEATSAVTHHVHYRLLDHDFDAASDHLVFLYACSAGLGGWSSRWPENAKGIPPVKEEPVMEVVPLMNRAESEDTYDGEWITTRRETFAMPTIERERLVNTKFHNRTPTIDEAFSVTERVTPSPQQPARITPAVPRRRKNAWPGRSGGLGFEP
jgi:hypothetical protein